MGQALVASVRMVDKSRLHMVVARLDHTGPPCHTCHTEAKSEAVANTNTDTSASIHVMVAFHSRRTPPEVHMD